MTNRLFSPSQQFLDQAGIPYAGGTLAFYLSGTSTPHNVYSDKLLATPRTNPVVLDSAGRAGSVFLDNVAYKVVLADANSVQVWTADPVYSSDYSNVAQVQAVLGNPNGQLAGNAGTVGGLPASVAWDITNSVLYIATVTGTAATTQWTAINSASTTFTQLPGGYLTPTSGTPVITSDSIGATSLVYTPFVGNVVPIVNGTSIANFAFNELSLALDATGHAADSLYDVFVYNNAGVLTLVTGPAWTTVTAGSSARGTGTGTTQLTRFNGVWTNAAAMTGRNGATLTTTPIPINNATYLGTIYTDHTGGQVTCHVSYGQNRKWGIWNAYNRMPIQLQAGDTTAAWTYNTATIRAANNAPSSWSSAAFNVGSGTTCNGITVLTGLAEEIFSLRYQNYATYNLTAANGAATLTIGVGWNSTSSFGSATLGKISGSIPGSVTNVSAPSSMISSLLQAPTLGINTVVALEDTNSQGDGTVSYKGTQATMLLSAQYRG